MKRGILLMGLPIASGILAVISLLMRRAPSTPRPMRHSTTSTEPRESNSAPLPPSSATDRLPFDRRTALGDFVTEFKRGGSPVLPAGDLSEDDLEFLAHEMGR